MGHEVEDSGRPVRRKRGEQEEDEAEVEAQDGLNWALQLGSL